MSTLAVRDWVRHLDGSVGQVLDIVGEFSSHSVFLDLDILGPGGVVDVVVQWHHTPTGRASEPEVVVSSELVWPVDHEGNPLQEDTLPNAVLDFDLTTSPDFDD